MHSHRPNPDARNDAMDKLETALELIEVPRRETFGDDPVRAELFARYATAFDLLVDWLFADKKFEEAIKYAELRRNRTFLDRIRSAGLEGKNHLEMQEKPDKVREIVQHFKESPDLGPFLYYYIGRYHSYAFLVGEGEIDAFRLDAGVTTAHIRGVVRRYIENLRHPKIRPVAGT